MDLSISTRSEGVHTIVEVVGELDVHTVPAMREKLAALIADGHYHLIADLQGVDFLDSTGLGVLVGGLKRVYPHDGTFQLVCTQERILKVFRITGLINVFSIHSSVADATSPSE